MNPKALVNLQGLSVVVTRPQQQGDNLLLALRALGADAVHIPLLAIEPLQTLAQRTRIDTLLQGLLSCQHAVFISQNAAAAALSALQKRGQTWPIGTQAYAIGRSTAALLHENGIEAICPARMDSEGLLAVPQLQKVSGQRGLIFRGLGGREMLALRLRERGMQVDYCELYRRCLPAEATQQWAAWQPSLPSVVCINSLETLDNMQLAAPHVFAMPHTTWLVPSERVAQAARARGLSVLCAPDALDETIINTLSAWCCAHLAPLTQRKEPSVHE